MLVAIWVPSLVGGQPDNTNDEDTLAQSMGAYSRRLGRRLLQPLTDAEHVLEEDTGCWGIYVKKGNIALASRSIRGSFTSHWDSENNDCE